MFAICINEGVGLVLLIQIIHISISISMYNNIPRKLPKTKNVQVQKQIKQSEVHDISVMKKPRMV